MPFLQTKPYKPNNLMEKFSIFHIDDPEQKMKTLLMPFLEGYKTNMNLQSVIKKVSEKLSM